jgi:hypothetical protein
MPILTITICLYLSMLPMHVQMEPLRMIAVPAAIETARYIAAAPVMYALMSVNEYITHRYYQHAEYNKAGALQFLARIFNLPTKIRGGGHVEHHAETYDDMSLKVFEDEAWKKTPAAKSLDGDVYRGTAFTWSVMALMVLQMLPTVLPIFKFVLGFSLPTTFAILLPSMLLHGLIWNALHPNMHGLPEVPFSVGPPSEWLAGLRNTAYFKYLYQNHEGHHVVGGQGNYNVCCPLTDHLVGSYVEETSWRPRQAVTVSALNDRRANAAVAV